MEFKEVHLDNGLHICAEINPQAFSQSLGYFVKTGSRDETPVMAGVSHFLEHMVFKGTSKRSAEDVNRELDELGSQSNAYTSEEQTVFYMSVIPEFQERAVELLTDLMRPALRTEDFETERQVILEEIAMYDDSPPYGAMERCTEEFFGDHPLSTRVLGTPHTVSELDPDAMREYHEGRYAPDNLVFTATGKVDFDRLVEQLSQLTRGWRPHSFQREMAQPNIVTKRLSLQHPPAIQQYTFQMSLGLHRLDPRRHAWRMLATILGDDSGSRIFWTLIDSGLAESAGMFAQEFDDCGILGAYLTCAPEATEENWKTLQDAIASALAEPISAKEVEIAKNKICASSILASERPSNRLFSVGNSVSLRGTYEPLERSLDNYRRVTEAMVNEALQEYLRRPHVTVSIGPEGGILS